jgi:4-amino-4-deoxy-L-arabinose transferase-like glycosyltransferase
VTCFIFLASAALCALLKRASVWLALGCGGALGLALLSKYSALIGLPIFALILLLRAALQPRWRMKVLPRSPELAATSRWKRVLLAATTLMLVSVTAGGVIWAFYGFRFHPWSKHDPAASAKQAVQEIFRSQNRLEREAQERWLRAAERVQALPEPYLLGLRSTLKHMERRLSFFLGARSLGGNRWYFPVALAVKTPLGLLLLCGLSGFGLARRRIRLPIHAALVLGLCPLIYFGNAVLSNLNIGQRHILPVYPFLFVLAGGAVPAAGASRCLRALAAAGLVWFAAASVWIHPDYLTYFNEIAGGPRGGMRYLGDSNLDWGQDLKRLRPWMERHGVEHIKLGYFGTALPQYYGLSYEWLPSTGFLNDRAGTRTVREGDYLAVSATCLQGFYFDDMRTYDFLDRFEPIDVIGHTLYIFHLVPQQLIR